MSENTITETGLITDAKIKNESGWLLRGMGKVTGGKKA
jgi:hypothetical protein